MAVVPASSHGGGSAAPVTRGTFAADVPSTIANGATAYLSWDDVSSGGGPVVDLSSNTTPVVLAAGVYAVAVGVEAEAMTAGGCFTIQLKLDASGEGIVLVTDSRTATAAEPVVFAAIAGTYYIPDAGEIRVRVQNRDGAATRDFGIQTATIQRIS
jgi:hypothetical protein